MVVAPPSQVIRSFPSIGHRRIPSTSEVSEPSGPGCTGNEPSAEGAEQLNPGLVRMRGGCTDLDDEFGALCAVVAALLRAAVQLAAPFLEQRPGGVEHEVPHAERVATGRRIRWEP
jgi:hypothetical protein